MSSRSKTTALCRPIARDLPAPAPPRVADSKRLAAIEVDLSEWHPRGHHAAPYGAVLDPGCECVPAVEDS